MVAITDLGTAADTASATCALTGVTVPAGATILMMAYEKTTTGSGGTFADTGGSNAYLSLTGGFPNNTQNQGLVGVWQVPNASALSGATITYTKNTSGVQTQISGAYLTNTTGITTGTFNAGLSTNPSATISSTSSGEIIIGWVGFNAVSGDTFTQDSANGSYATPPDILIANGNGIAGGSFIKGAAGSISYAPSISNSRTWGAIIAAYAAAPTGPTTLYSLMNVG